MSDDLQLSAALAEPYAAALHALARADGEIGAEEAQHLELLLARRSPVKIDPEELFFAPATPEAFAMTVRKDPQWRDIGRALIRDAVALATADGDLNGLEANAIIRYAKALGLRGEDVHAESALLDEWLHQLG